MLPSAWPGVQITSKVLSPTRMTSPSFRSRVTFYAQHGDYLSRIAVYLTFVLLMAWVAFGIIRHGKSSPTATTKAPKKPAKRKK